MTDSTEATDTKETVAHHIYLASIYFIIIGIIYLWAYWLSFDINILDYLALSDVIKATAFPITTAAVLLILINAISDKVANSLPEVDIERTPSNLRRAKLFLDLTKLAFLATTATVLALDISRKSEILALLFGTYCYYQLGRTSLFSKQISNQRMRTSVIFIMTFLPVMAFLSGKIDARSVLSGKLYSYVISDIDGFDANNATKTASRLRLVGSAGEFMFLYNPNTQATLMMKLGDDKPLVFKKNREAETFNLPAMIRKIGILN